MGLLGRTLDERIEQLSRLAGKVNAYEQQAPGAGLHPSCNVKFSADWPEMRENLQRLTVENHSRVSGLISGLQEAPGFEGKGHVELIQAMPEAWKEQCRAWLQEIVDREISLWEQNGFFASSG